MKKRFVIACGILSAMLLTALITNAGAPVVENGQKPGDVLQQTAETNRLKKDAAVYQVMHFERCGHPVERRVRLPEQLAGEGFERVRAYYDQWVIRRITQENVEMERHLDLYCPMHKVVYLDRAGQLVLAENKYGDGMAIIKTLKGKIPDDELRNRLIAGVGFDSESDAEKWLEEMGICP